MTTYQIGQRVYADLSGGGRVRAAVGYIEKITATGQTTVKFTGGETLRFNKRGQILGDHFSFEKLIDETAFNELCARIAILRKQNAVRDARKNLNALPIDTENKQALLDAVKALHDAIERL